jgi:hypothetical protein
VENTKRWSAVFLWIGRISIITLLLVLFRLKIGFEIPTQQQLKMTLTNIKYVLLILAPLSLMIGYAIKSIYTETLHMFRKLNDK